MKKILLLIFVFLNSISFGQSINKISKEIVNVYAIDTLTNFSTLTWTGSFAPSTIEDNLFEYSIDGGITSFLFHLDYTSQGTANTALTFRLPADDDEQILPLYGLNDGQAKVVATGYAYVIDAIDGSPKIWNCWINKNASEEYTVHLDGEIVDAKVVFGILTYKSNN